MVHQAEHNKNYPYDWRDESGADGYDYTAPVGSYPTGAGPYGALDMAGNALEWVADRYDEEYYQYSPYQNPTGPGTGSFRVARGDAFSSSAWSFRRAHRSEFQTNYYYIYVGFRVAMSP